MRSLNLTKRVQKCLLKLPVKQREQVARQLVALRHEIEPQDSKKLKGYDLFRVDCGEYRIIYDWDNTTVRVFLIGKRNDPEVYKKLDRLLR